MSHRIEPSLAEKLKAAIPFGIGRTKPQHFRDMAKIAWKNRDNLGYAWKVLSRGVCDGCALGVAGFHDWTIKGVHLCMTRLNLLRLNTLPALDVKLLEDVSQLASLDNAQLRELGRLPYPMVRERGDTGFRRITWDEAYERMARRLRGIDPRRWAMFVTSRGVTNEVYYMAQKVCRFLGTNNIDNAARLCHAPSTAAMKHAIGVAAATCSYKDWYGTDLIVFFGSNPANDQPVTTKYLHEAKKLGTKIALVNPYLEPGMKRYWVPSSARSAVFGTALADYWFPVAQGGDIAFLHGVLKILFANGWLDHDFMRDHTVGGDELHRAGESLGWAALEKQSGLPWRSMEEFAHLIRDAKTAVLVWSMGITQHACGADAVQMILNLGLARGYVGRDRCGLMPIRGHSSVQGGAEMGAYATAFPGGKTVNTANARALGELYGFDVPDWPGLATTEMVEAGGRGELDLLYCLGGNFLRTLPEPDHVRAALANIPVRVHQDIILTDQLFIEPKEEMILLPAKTRYEQDDGGTETTTERRIAFSPEIPRQVGEAKAEWKILRELAAATKPGLAHLLACETGWKMREEIARVVPFYEGVQHLKKTGDAIQYGGPHLCAGGQFPTPDGKARFKVVALPEAPVPTPMVNGQWSSRKEAGSDTAGEATRSPEPDTQHFTVSTRRGKQFNTLIYAEVDPLNGAPRDAVLMNAEDARRLGFREHDRVRLANAIGSYEGRVCLAPLARGNLQIHWPEGNVIIPRGIVDAGGGVPDYNTRVQVSKA